MANFYGVLRGKGRHLKTVCGNTFVEAQLSSRRNKVMVSLDKDDRLMVTVMDVDGNNRRELLRQTLNEPAASSSGASQPSSSPVVSSSESPSSQPS